MTVRGFDDAGNPSSYVYRNFWIVGFAAAVR
jgi:hypothetical protein